MHAGRWRSSVRFEQLEVVCGHLVPSPADEHNGTRRGKPASRFMGKSG